MAEDKKKNKEEMKNKDLSKDKDEKIEETLKKEEKEKSKDEEKEQETKVEGEKDISKKTKTFKKEEAVANGFSLRISPKYAVAICKVIRGKSPDAAIKRLEDVVLGKRAIPMAGLEVAHQKGRGLSGAKFPKNACEGIIAIIKQVRANAIVAGIEDPVIIIAKANKASAPFRRGGRRAKRAHVHLKVVDKTKLVKNKK